MCGGNNAFSDFFIRPDRWLREHRDEAKIAAIVAAAVAAPYVVGAAGAAGGAGAAAAGGVGAAEGAGLTAAEYAALTGIEGGSSVGFAAGAGGAGAVEGGLIGAGTGAADYAALSGMESGALGGQAALEAMPAYAALDSAPAGGLLGADPMALGADPTMGTASGNPLEAWGNVDPHAMENGIPDFNSFGAQADVNLAKLRGMLTGDNVYKGLKAMNAANQYSKLAQPPATQRVAARPQGGGYQGGGHELAALQQLYSSPAAAERLKQLLRARGVQV